MVLETIHVSTPSYSWALKKDGERKIEEHRERLVVVESHGSNTNTSL